MALTAQVQWAGTYRRHCSLPTPHTKAEEDKQLYFVTLFVHFYLATRPFPAIFVWEEFPYSWNTKPLQQVYNSVLSLL